MLSSTTGGLPPQLARSSWRPTPAERRRLRRESAHFLQVRKVEGRYAQQLRAVGRTVGRLINAFDIGDQSVIPEMLEMLARYAETLQPWARATARRLIAEISRRDAVAWFKSSRDIGVGLRELIEQAPIGFVAQQLVNDQVDLITSLPIEAGRRVQKHTMEFVTSGRRYDELVELVKASGEVTTSRATLIARTETAKAQSAIMQARAQFVGADQYIWRTVRDSRVRAEHRRLEGTVHRWNDPPVAEANGERHHPGEFPNCFPGSTLISSLEFGCRGLYRGMYKGPLLNFVIGSEIIEVTPNHPILTPSGWVKAEVLEEGDQVVSMGVEGSSIWQNYKNKTETTFHQLFESLVPYGFSNSFASLNFHGDVVDDDIDHVSFDEFLSFYLKTVGFEQFTKLPLTKSDSWIENRSIMTSFDHIVKSSLSSGLNAFDTNFRGLVSGDELICFLSGSKVDTTGFQDTTDCSGVAVVSGSESRTSESLSIQIDDFLSREDFHSRQTASSFSFAGVNSSRSEFKAEDIGVTSELPRNMSKVHPSRYHLLSIVKKGFSDFSGHVYTMQSETGYYCVGKANILAKNCRCYAEPVISDVIT
jgi:SPP1 gp7 family putative phage head morphogenesis protein